MAYQNPVTVFISYAHEDEAFLKELVKHLGLLKRQGLITSWYDRQIVPGTNWTEAIDEQLEQASIILLLISPDFLASDYCYQVEMQRALGRHQAGRTRVIPISIRPCDWKSAPFAHLQALPTDAKAITTWRNRDEAFVDVVAGIRSAIEDLSLPSTSTSRTALPLVWNIPYPRNSFFTGRDDILSLLYTQLRAGQAAALSQSPQAISGLGGIGKTQIAVEYAYRHHQDYQAVLWTRSDAREALVSGYLEIAQLLNLSQKDELDQNLVVKAVKEWFRTHSQWLLILDNADELDIVREFLPPTFGGQILLTTRAQSLGRLAARIEVETMDRDIGALLLLRRAGIIMQDAALERASPSDIALAKEITEELGGLPLALDQAGAYIEETPCSLSMYQVLYRTRNADLLMIRGGLVDDHPQPVATTWSLSFRQVEQKNPAAADLLRLCAFLAPDSIPEAIITRGASHLGSQLAPINKDPYLLNQAIKVLYSYSLLRRDMRSSTESHLSVHRLVQAVLKDQMDERTSREWAERTVRAVMTTFPDPSNFAAWTECEQWIPHVVACDTLIEQYHIVFAGEAAKLSDVGYYLTRRARYREAEPLLKRSVQVCKQVSGSENYELASCVKNLASLYRRLARHEEAIPLYEQAANICERLFGPEDLRTIQCLNSLATTFEGAGKYAEAEILYQRVLIARERQLGPSHAETADTLTNFGDFYRSQGKYEDAEKLLQRALAIYEQVGPMHPADLSTCLTYLGDLYFEQAKYAKAEPMYQRALSISEHVFGREHPDTQIDRKNYAKLLRALGRGEEAKQMEERS